MPGGQEVGVGGVKLPKAHGHDAELKALKANKRAHILSGNTTFLSHFLFFYMPLMGKSQKRLSNPQPLRMLITRILCYTPSVLYFTNKCL